MITKQDDDLLAEIAPFAKKVTVPTNTTLFRQGDDCLNYLLVASGTVRVFTRAENGREIMLYRVQHGESCTLTTSCLLADNKYPAEAVSETEVCAYMISAQHFNEELNKSSNFRKFVFDTYSKRLRDVIALVEQVSFGRIDIRLAKYLLQYNQQPQIMATHQEIATELGTAREVVSRQLKDFERQQWLALSRGRITLLNTDALRKLANLAGH